MEMDTIQIISLVLGSNLVNTIVTAWISRRKNTAEVNKTNAEVDGTQLCLLYTSPSPRDRG